MRNARTSDVVAVWIMWMPIAATLLFCTAAISVRTTVWLEHALGWSFPVSASAMEYVYDVRAVARNMHEACVEDAPQAEMDRIIAQRDALRAESRWKVLRALVFGTNEFTHDVIWVCAYRGTQDAYVVVRHAPRRTS